MTEAQGNPLLQVDDLHVYFPVRRGSLLRRKTLILKAVDGVSFDVKEGETFSIVGESGCGKTTTARAILKVETPTSGSIHWQGRNLRDIDEPETRAYRSAVQAVFQDPYSSMNPRLRIGDFITEPLLLKSGSAAGSGASAPAPHSVRSACEPRISTASRTSSAAASASASRSRGRSPPRRA